MSLKESAYQETSATEPNQTNGYHNLDGNISQTKSDLVPDSIDLKQDSPQNKAENTGSGRGDADEDPNADILNRTFELEFVESLYNNKETRKKIDEIEKRKAQKREADSAAATRKIAETDADYKQICEHDFPAVQKIKDHDFAINHLLKPSQRPRSWKEMEEYLRTLEIKWFGRCFMGSGVWPHFRENAKRSDLNQSGFPTRYLGEVIPIGMGEDYAAILIKKEQSSKSNNRSKEKFFLKADERHVAPATAKQKTSDLDCTDETNKISIQPFELFVCYLKATHATFANEKFERQLLAQAKNAPIPPYTAYKHLEKGNEFRVGQRPIQWGFYGSIVALQLTKSTIDIVTVPKGIRTRIAVADPLTHSINHFVITDQVIIVSAAKNNAAEDDHDTIYVFATPKSVFEKQDGSIALLKDIKPHKEFDALGRVSCLAYNSYFASGVIAWGTISDCATHVRGLLHAEFVFDRVMWPKGGEQRKEVQDHAKIARDAEAAAGTATGTEKEKQLALLAAAKAKIADLALRPPPPDLRQPCTKIVITDGGAILQSSSDNFLALFPRKVDNNFDLVQPIGGVKHTIDFDTCGNVMVTHRASHLVQFHSLVDDDDPTKAVAFFDTKEEIDTSKCPSYSRHYKSLWLSTGRIAILCPTGHLFFLHPMDSKLINKISDETYKIGQELKLQEALESVQKFKEKSNNSAQQPQTTSTSKKGDSRYDKLHPANPVARALAPSTADASSHAPSTKKLMDELLKEDDNDKNDAQGPPSKNEEKKD